MAVTASMPHKIQNCSVNDRIRLFIFMVVCQPKKSDYMEVKKWLKVLNDFTLKVCIVVILSLFRVVKIRFAYTQKLSEDLENIH